MGSVQEALEARKKRKEREQSKVRQSYQEKDDKVSNALKARDKRKQSNLSNLATDWQERLNAEVEAYNKNIAGSKLSYGKDTLGNALERTRTNTTNLDQLRKEVEGYRYYLGDEKTDEFLKSLDAVYGGYDSYLKSAEAYSKFESEEDYNKAVEAQKIYEGKKTFDLDAGKLEIEELEKKADARTSIKSQIDTLRGQQAQYYSQRNTTKAAEIGKEIAALQAQYDAYGDVDSQLAEKKVYYRDAERIQTSSKLYDEATKAVDFGEKSQYVSTKYDKSEIWGKLTSGYGLGYEDLTYEYINDVDGMRSEIEHQASLYAHESYTDGETIYEEKAYDELTEDEIKVYNYYYATQGKDKAQEYLDSIEGTLIQRKANKIAQNAEERNLEWMLAITAGLDQWATGVKGTWNAITGNETITDPTAIQYASGMVRENIDSNFWRGAYDLGVTMSNQLPSILVGAVTGGAGGLATMGVSVYGNSYQEMINLGYNKSQANTYATLTTAAELGLQSVLGGYKVLGGKLSQGITEGFASLVDHAIAKFAIRQAGSMISEGVEEGLQSILEPLFKSYVTGESFDVDWSEVGYSALLGAVSAGALEGVPSVVGAGINAGINTAETISAGKEFKKSGDIGKLKSFASDTNKFAADTVAHKLAGKVDENTSAYKIGKLLREVNGYISEQNKADLTKSLTRKGIQPKDAEVYVNALAAIAEGYVPTSREIVALNADPAVRQTLIDVIINENSTVNQRIQGYNEAIGLVKNGGKTSAETAQNSTNATGVENVSTESGTAENAEQESVFSTSDDGKTYIKGTNEAVSVKEISSIQDGVVKVRLEDGREVDARELDLASKDEVLLYEMVTNLGVDSETANTMMASYNKGKGTTSPENFRADGELAYKYGLIGYIKGLANLNLTGDQKVDLFGLGRKQAEKTAEKINSASQNGVSKGKAVQFEGKQTEKNGIIYEGVDPNSVKKGVRRASIIGMEILANSSNLEIHAFESKKDANGNIVAVINGQTIPAPNGMFRDGNRIYVDINAGDMQQGTMLYTLAHEVGHFIRQWNAKAFKELGDFLFEHYEGETTVDELIDREMRLLKAQLKAELKAQYKAEGKAIPSDAELEKQLPSETKLYDEAYEDVVCNALSKMLADENAYIKLAELKKQNHNLWAKIGEAIKAFLKKLKKAIGVYSKYDVSDRNAAMTKEMATDVYNQLQDMYIKAFVEADANYATHNTSEPNDVDTKFSVRETDPPQNTIKGYKVFFVKGGKLYPPMVANPNGEGTPKGVWLDADDGQLAYNKDGTVKTNSFGRPRVKAGGKGTQGGSGDLAYRPGWHLGDLPMAKQFARADADGNKTLFPERFVWAECDVAADIEYQEEADAMGYKFSKNGKFNHQQASLDHMPRESDGTAGYYRYRTNPDPTTEAWIITGAMKVNRLLKDEEVNSILKEHGRDPMPRQGGELNLKKLGLTEDDFAAKYSTRDSAENAASEADWSRLRKEYNTAWNSAQEAKKKLDSIGKNPNYDEIVEIVTDKNASSEDIQKALDLQKKWEMESGYSEAYEEYDALYKKARELRSESDRMEERLSKALREQKYSEEEVNAIVQKAVRKYHTTARLNRASYLLTTGSMLDFSEGQGYRVKDHREISEILNMPDYAQYSDGMIVFMNMGNIRLQTYGIDIASMPNTKQFSALRGIISEVMRECGEFTVDFSKPNGNTDGSVTYPEGVSSSRIISDIKNYFETGTIPEYEDSLSQFRYSTRDSEGNELSKEQQEFFKDSKVRDENGNLLVVYHGTRKADFTEFKRNINYYTDSSEMADSYAPSGEQFVGYLNIKKPFVIDAKGERWSRVPIDEKVKALLEKYGVGTFKEKGKWRTSPADIASAIEEGIDEGELDYDGIIIKNVDDTGRYWKTRDNIVANDYITFKSNQFKNADNKAPTSNPDIRYSVREGMTEEERYNELKDKKINVFEDTRSANYSSEIKSIEELHKKAKSKAERIIKPLAEKLGILNKSMKTPEVEIDFIFSKNKGLTESLSKQLRYGGSYADFAKAIINLDKVLENAILIEVHGEKFTDTFKADTNLDRVYVLFSAFKDGESIIPIQLEIKKLSHEGGRLYMTVAMTKIKADVLGRSLGYKNNLVPSLISASEYSLADIFRNVNQLDGHFLKYIPNDFLTEAQQESKQIAIEEDNERLRGLRDEYYLDAVKRGDMAIAQKMIDEAAKKAGYTVLAYHGTDDEFTVFDKKKIGSKTDYGWFGRGFYFHIDADTSKIYGKNNMGSYLKINKLLDLNTETRDDEGFDDAMDRLMNKKHEDNESRSKDFTKWLVANGYDGVAAWGQRMVLNPNQIKSADTVTYDDNGKVIPLSERFKSENNDIRYSVRDPEVLEQREKVDKVLEIENAKLKEDNQYLKELVKLQRQVTHGTKFTKSSVETVSSRLMRYANAKGNRAELVKLLNDFYEYIAEGKDLTWESVTEKAQPAIDWLKKHIVYSTELDANSREMINTIRSKRIYLDEQQQAEAAHIYGTFQEYRKRTMGSLTIVSKDNPKGATSLDSQWQELATMYPDYFDADITPNDMPRKLLEIVDSLRNTNSNEYEFSDDMVDQDLLNQVYDGYWDVSTLHTVADSKQKEITKLKIQHRKKMTEVREYHNEKHNQLKKEHRDKVARIREEYRERNAKTTRELLTRWQESRKKGVEGRHKTEIRNRLKKTIADLRKILNNGTKERNVKIELQDSVSKALALADILLSDEYNNEAIVRFGVDSVTEKEAEMLAQYNALLDILDPFRQRLEAMHEQMLELKRNKAPEAEIEALKAKMEEIRSNPEYTKASIKKSELNKALADVFVRERNRYDKEKAESIMDALIKAYESLQDSKTDFIKNAYSKELRDRLVSIRQTFKNVSIKDMSLNDLHDIYKAYVMVKHVITESNTLFRNGRKEDMNKRIKAVQNNLRSMYKTRKDRPKFIDSPLGWLRSFSWNNLRPVDAFERLGVNDFTELFWDAVEAQDVYARDVVEAGEVISNAREKYGYKKWDLKTAKTFKTANGLDFKLTLGDLMSIYAYSFREQAFDHMTIGGFTFDTGKTYKETKNGVTKVHAKTSETYIVSEQIIQEIINSLTEEQRAYVKEIQQYLTELGAKGNEVARILYGIDIFTEEHYFPLQSEQDYRSSVEEALNKTQTMVSLKNTGMTKATVPHAKNPIVLRAFDDVVLEHIDKMSKYHAYVIPIENLQKVFNNSNQEDVEQSPTATKALIASIFGEEAKAYFDQYITDLNGGGGIGGAKNPLATLFGRAKGVAVAANLSVVAQQYFAVVRAMTEIDAKYFVPFINGQASKSEGSSYEELKKYAPVAVIKEMGGFDVGSNRGAKDYIGMEEAPLSKEKVWKGFQDATMAGASLMDRFGWVTIWKAVKKEIASTRKDLKVGSEEFLQACGKRFSEVVTKTQVYDSVNTRSGFMRSKHESVKYLTSFMGEPTVSVGMYFTSINNFVRAVRNKDKALMKKTGAKMARTLVTLPIAGMLTAVAKSAVQAMRDDDDEETFVEKWMENYVSNFKSDIMPWTYLPIGRDIQSLIDGWDVERPDMTLIADLIDGVGKIFDEDSDVEDILGAVGAFANMFGIPLKNVIRDTRGFISTIGSFGSDEKTTGAGIKNALKEGWTGDEISNGEQLYEAILNGDNEQFDRVKARYDDADKLKSAIRTAFKKHYLAGDIDYNTTIQLLVEYGEMDEDEAYWKLREWDYEIEHGDTEDYAKYGDFYTAVESGKNLKAVIKQYTDNGVEKSTLASQITSHFKPLYKEMTNSQRASIKGYLLNAYALLGYDRAKKSKDIDNWLKD